MPINVLHKNSLKTGLEPQTLILKATALPTEPQPLKLRHVSRLQHLARLVARLHRRRRVQLLLDALQRNKVNQVARAGNIKGSMDSCSGSIDRIVYT